MRDQHHREKEILKQILAPLGKETTEAIFDAIWGEEAMKHWNKRAENKKNCDNFLKEVVGQ